MSILLPKIILIFMWSLSLGTALFSWIADPKLTGAGFMRLITGHGFIFLALGLLLGFIFEAQFGEVWWILPAFLLFVLGAQWKFHPDHRSPLMWSLFGLQTLLTLLFYFISAGGTVSFFFLFSSAFFLGITHYAMLLGHYYLVVPKLTERPLLVCMKVFWVTLVVKMGFSCWGTWGAADYLSEETLLGDGYTFNWLVISMRWLWGYGALAILSWFAWRLCRMRSIQSATGVLYIMVFFVFIGELLSTYLYLKHGLAI
jgi:hypothetical protein